VVGINGILPKKFKVSMVGGIQSQNGSVNGFLNPTCPYDLMNANSSLQFVIDTDLADDTEEQATDMSLGSLSAAELYDFSILRTVNGSHIIYGGRSVQAASDTSTTVIPREVASSATFILPYLSNAWNIAGGSMTPPVNAKMSDGGVGRYLHCACTYNLGHQEYMLIYGGQTSSSFNAPWRPDSAVDPDLQVLNLNNNSWSSLEDAGGNPPPYRFGHSCVISYPYMIVYAGALADDSYILRRTGGKSRRNGMALPGPGQMHTSKDLYLYNIQTNSWTEMITSGAEPHGRAFHTAALMFDNTMMVVGGVQDGYVPPSFGRRGDPPHFGDFVVTGQVAALQLNFDTEQYSTWIETKAPPIPFGSRVPLQFEARYSHSMLQLSNSTLLVLGGVTQDGNLANDIWLCQLTTPKPDPEDPTGDINVNRWMFYGAITAGIALVGVLIGTVIVRQRRKKQSNQNLQRLLAGMEVQGDNNFSDTKREGEYNDLGNRVRSPTWETAFSDQLQDAPEFIIDFQSVRIVKQIGHGSTCAVYVGWWSRGVNDAPQPVAVKRFFLESAFKREDFFRENLIHKKLKHPNVLELYAVTADPPCSVTELMWQGSLYHLLQTDRDIPFCAALQFAIDAAEGMRYLHSEGVLHRDLKTLNLLVNDTGRVKVCDFGISRLKASMMTTGAGSIQYMAPEVFVSAHYTEKSDIYSFAIILWELLSRETPYQKVSQFESWVEGETSSGRVPTEFMVMSEVRNGKRLLIPEGAPAVYAELIADCWAHDSQQRPGFPEILRRLREMEVDYPMNGLDINMTEMLTRPASSSLRDQMAHSSELLMRRSPTGTTPRSKSPPTGFTPHKNSERSPVKTRGSYKALVGDGDSGETLMGQSLMGEGLNFASEKAAIARDSQVSMRSTMSSDLEFERDSFIGSGRNRSETPPLDLQQELEQDMEEGRVIGRNVSFGGDVMFDGSRTR